MPNMEPTDGQRIEALELRVASLEAQLENAVRVLQDRADEQAKALAAARLSTVERHALRGLIPIGGAGPLRLRGVGPALPRKPGT